MLTSDTASTKYDSHIYECCALVIRMKMFHLIDLWVKSIKQHPSRWRLIRANNYNGVLKKYKGIKEKLFS